jgi:hypothetical protein
LKIALVGGNDPEFDGFDYKKLMDLTRYLMDLTFHFRPVYQRGSWHSAANAHAVEVHFLANFWRFLLTLSGDLR